MRIIILILSLVLTTSVFAQKIDILKKGHNYYKNEEYQLAMRAYEMLWNSGSGAKILGVDGKMNLADCYRRTDQPFKAKELYMKTMDYFGDKPEAHLHYGQVLMNLGQYNDAIAQFERHIEMMPEDGQAQKFIKKIEELRDIQPLYPNVNVVAQEEVNQPKSNETGVAYYGDAIVYTTNEATPGSNDKYYNMMISGIDADGNLKSSEKFSVSLNVADRDDGPATFSRDGRLVYYTISATDPEGKPVQQIWISSFRDGVWEEAQPLPIMYQGKNFTQPCLSADRKQLYFASDMKGTFGGMDIWVSNFEDGRWTAAKNLGKDINTKEDEGWPFIHPTDGDLYFSSKGHVGYGGFDIFRTRPLGNGVDWLDVENMGEPFNTSFSDISFVLSDDQTEGFIVSNRNKSMDVYRYELVGEEAQPLPDDVSKRTSTGISEERKIEKLTDVPTTDNTDPAVEPQPVMPERQEGETEDDYNFRKKQFEKRLEETTIDDIPDPEIVEGRDGEDKVQTPTDEVEPGKVELIVKMQAIDGFNNPIPNAVIVVRNKYTDKIREYNTNGKGLTEIRLDPDQKYVFTGQKEGYMEASLPVSTMGATRTETVAASIKLQAK